MSTTKIKRKASLPIADFYNEVLKNDKLAAAYLSDAIATYTENGEWPELQLVLQNITRLKGVTATAKRMGISRQSLSNTINGESVPSAVRLMKLLAALGYQLEVKLSASVPNPA